MSSRLITMAAREYDLEIAAIDATLVSIEKVLDLPKLRASAIELEAAAGVPDLWMIQRMRRR